MSPVGTLSSRPSAVLGLDAAWTTTRPSGVALVLCTEDGGRVVAVAPSYSAFMELASGIAVSWSDHHPGTAPDLPGLLRAAQTLAGVPVTAIAVDMPLAHGPITGRRAADNLISQEYGRLGCGTHSPSATCPGPIASTLRDAAGRLGYPLATMRSPTNEKALLETYPHPAVVDLLHADYRVKYKVGKIRKYWPELAPDARRREVAKNLFNIIGVIERLMGPCGLSPNETNTLATLKRIEDVVDALICCWVGICWLEGRAHPYGDDEAVIWLPRRGPRSTGDPLAEASHD